MGCSSEEEPTTQLDTSTLPPAPSTNPLGPTGGSGPITEDVNAAAGSATSADAITVAGVTMDIPEGWTPEPPASSMRLAQFSLPGDAGPAELSVFAVGGGIDMNIDRWIGQFSDVVAGPERDTISRDGLEIGTLFIAGSYVVGPMMGGTGEPQPGTAFLGAVILNGSQQAQLKLVGPAATIEAQRDAWNSMIESVSATN
jgi:hypothetical protein